MFYLNLFTLTATPERTAPAEVAISSPEDLKDVPTKVLVDFYNKAIPSSPVKKFATREKAVERVYPLMVSTANAPPSDTVDHGWEMPESIPSPGSASGPQVETQEETPQEETVASATSAKKKSTGKKKAAGKKASANGKRGRAPLLTGAKLFRVGEENPCRAGGIRAKSWDLIRSGMTYEKYLENGGDANALAFNIRTGRVKVEKATKGE